MAAEGILRWVGIGQRKYWALHDETPLENLETLLAKFRKLGFRYFNDYTVTPILYIPLPKFETPLVGNVGGQLLPLPTLFRNP